MRTRVLTLLVMPLVMTSVLVAQKRIPVPSDAEQRRLIDEGNELHDNQNSDAAIARYESVLQRNPGNIEALLELTTTYFEKGDFNKSLDAALKGTEYASEHLGYFYVIAGTCHDALGRQRQAEAIYREGLRFDSTNYLLRYNLGVTLLKSKRTDDAAANFRGAVLLNPNHASSHIGLGQVYVAQGDRIAALLAYARALVLEPGTSRSERAVVIISGILGLVPEGAATPSPKSRRVSAPEPSFVAARRLSDSLRAAVPATLEFQEAVRRLGEVLNAAAGSTTTRGTSFAARYYGAYYRDLVDRGYAEALAAHIFQSIPVEGLSAWRSGNEPRLADFMAWSRESRWPTELQASSR